MNTVDWEIFAVKFFCQLFRQRKIFYGEWLENAHAPCGENSYVRTFLTQKKKKLRENFPIYGSQHDIVQRFLKLILSLKLRPHSELLSSADSRLYYM